MFGQFFRSLRRARQMDPLHVTMTGVRMGERFVQIGCDDPALLSGLAAKVGLSGASAVAVFEEADAERARRAAARIGALIDVRVVTPENLPFETADMVVVDDTRGSFARMPDQARKAVLTGTRRLLRDGGRIEVVERVALTGFLGGAVTRPDGYSVEALLAEAGFRPVRLLAEKAGIRFVEGLKG